MSTAVVCALARHKEIKQMLRIMMIRRAVEYLRKGMAALENAVLKRKKREIVTNEINARELVRTVQKTFMGLRYQCLIQRNTRTF